MEPGQGLLERPIPYDVPVPGEYSLPHLIRFPGLIIAPLREFAGGDSLQIALSGFDELQAAQLARFVQALGTRDHLSLPTPLSRPDLCPFSPPSRRYNTN